MQNKAELISMVTGFFDFVWFIINRALMPIGLIIWAMYISLHRGYMTEITRFGCGVYSVYNELPESKTVSCSKNLMKNFNSKGTK